MTWLIGASSIFGYGALLSDIQVSVEEQRFDILQKAYPLHKFIIGGFSGSVKIGFMLLQSLSDHLQISPNSDHLEWDTLKIISNWAPIAKNIFNEAPPPEKKLKSKFLIVATSPHPAKGTYPPGWDSQIYLIRFSSPDFKPQIMSKKGKFCSIGSGASITKLKRFFQEREKLGISDKRLQSEIMNPGGWVKNLEFSLFHLLSNNPQDGISKHFNILTITRNEIINRPCPNYKTYLPNGLIIEDILPKLAKNYDELKSMLKERGIKNASEAVC
jgi:hypothetical protein